MTYSEWMIAEVEAVFDLSPDERMQLEDILAVEADEDDEEIAQRLICGESYDSAVQSRF